MDDLATKEFIERAKAIHGERYDYSRSRYTGSDNKLIIICREHGPFRQSPYNHTSSRLKCGCPRCAARRRADVQIANAAREFIQRARARHGDRYDYSKVRYKSAHSKVLIGCPLHGDFWQKADSHIRQSGCPKCGVLLCARLKIEQASNTFVAKAQKVHGHKYDYSETRYLASREKVVIRCRKHGPYLQTPNHHLNGDGCPCCHRDSLRSQFTKAFVDFRRDAESVHGTRFSYVDDYVNCKTPVTIVCAYHGPFRQTPSSHLRGAQCPKCADASQAQTRAMTHDEFVAKAKAVHKGKDFAYPETYRRAISKISIRCPHHRIFQQTPNSHLSGHGCPRCAGEAAAERLRSDNEAFLTRAREIHGDRYRYLQPYEASDVLMSIVCPKHGVFKQRPSKHVQGQGCPVCTDSSGERFVALALDRMGISYVRQKAFPTCRDKRLLRFDFWLPKLKLLLEYDGQQHFQSIEHWGGDESFRRNIRRDEIKSQWANKNGYRLVRIPYTARNIPKLLRLELAC